MSPDPSIMIGNDLSSPNGSSCGDSGYHDDDSCKDFVVSDQSDCLETPRRRPSRQYGQREPLVIVTPFSRQPNGDRKISLSSKYNLEPIALKTVVAKAKVIVLGNSGVGKTSVIYSHRFGVSGVHDHAATIGASYVKVLVDIDDKKQVQLQVWDTAGQERFRCMVPMYTRNATAAFVFYDISERKSFEDVDKWVNDLRRCSGDPFVVVIGNKSDREFDRQVTIGEGRIKATKLNAMFFELNAHNPVGINSVFDAIGEKVLTAVDEAEMCDSGYESQSSSSMNSPVLRISLSKEPFSKSLKTPKKFNRDCCTLL